MKSLLRYTIGLSTITGLICLTTSAPILANPFNVCTRDMIRSGIAPEAAGAACADALSPRDLSVCVSQIDRRTAIAPEAALDACFRVRRPKDLAICVRNINNNVATTEENLSSVLDNCRKSLLPGRYAQCVTGVSRQVASIDLEQAMDKCLSAQDYPTDLFPAYTQ